jgi:hypothetical protein
MGYRPKPDYVARTYGDNYEFVPPPPAPPAAEPGLLPAFADPLPGGSVERMLEADGWRKLIGPQVEGLEALLSECHSLEEFRDRLGELALSDPTQLTDAMARMMFTARVAGNASAEEADGQGD